MSHLNKRKSQTQGSILVGFLVALGAGMLLFTPWASDSTNQSRSPASGPPATSAIAAYPVPPTKTATLNPVPPAKQTVIAIETRREATAIADATAQPRQSPVISEQATAVIPTQAAYPPPGTLPPLPTRTPPVYPTMGPKETRPPKPTNTPIPTPTITPIPTALPLPPSAFHALWVEGFPNPQSVPIAPYEGSILWKADPRDIGSREALARFEDQLIREVSVSPNGREIAFTTAPRLGIPKTLWVAKLDGSDLRQLAPDASQLLWSQDSRSIVYGASQKIEGTDGSAIDIVDVTSGIRTRLQTFEPDLAWQLVSWAANQREVYFARAKVVHLYPRDLWVVETNTKAIRKVAELDDDINVATVSPDGSKYLISVSQGLAWRFINQQSQKVILQPGRGFTAIWSSNNRELITSEWGTDPKQMTVRAIEVNTLASRNLGVISPPANLRLLALSPDETWLAIDQDASLFWVHLPTGLKVPVPSSNSPLRFGAWANK